jgi:hypothetical protein
VSTGRTDQLAAIRAHCARPPQTVLFDEPTGSLFDIFSGKTLPLQAADLTQVEPRADKETGAPYLVLRYGDGHELALTQAGLAFAPGFRNTGALEGLPVAVCFRDFRELLDRLKHELYGHPEVAPTRAALDALMRCIAILDGARAVGFDVSREEPELETHLAQLEQRAPKP